GGGGVEGEEDVPRLAPAALERVVPVRREEGDEALAGVLAGPEGGGRQPVAQGGDLVLRRQVGCGLGGAEGGRHSRRLTAFGPRHLPHGRGGLLGEGELDGVAGREGLEETVDVLTELGLTLPRKDIH